MADSAVAITAGTGTNIDTRTEGTNGNHRQVVVLGDPATNAGVAPVDATAGLKVDLGADNDVTVTGGVLAAVAGPAGITVVDSMTSAVVDLAAGTANQSVVAAPGASHQIWVYGLLLKTNGTTATVVLQDEDDTALTGTITLTDSDGYVLPPSGSFEMPWFKVASNKALEIDTGGSGTVDGHIMYAVVDVS